MTGKMGWMACVVVSAVGLLSMAAERSKAQGMYYGDGSFILGNRARVVSVNLLDGKLHVEWRESSNITYCEGGHPPDSVWKEIYAASNGVVVLDRKVEGTVVPAQKTQERVEWPDEESRKVPPPPWQSWTNLTGSNALVANGMSLVGSNCMVSCATNYVTNYVTNSTLRATGFWGSASAAWAFHVKGMKLSPGKDGLLELELDKGVGMSEAASNFVAEVRRQLDDDRRMRRLMR